MFPTYFIKFMKETSTSTYVQFSVRQGELKIQVLAQCCIHFDHILSPWHNLAIFKDLLSIWRNFESTLAFFAHYTNI